MQNLNEARIVKKNVNITHVPRPSSGLSKKTSFRGPSKFQNLPNPTGQSPYHLDLKDIIDKNEYDRILRNNKLIFHIDGDVGGVKDPVPQHLVVSHMENQFDKNNPADNPSFFYIVGDVVYFFGEKANYFDQFYDPYIYYPAPIVAIPGNHDGDVDTNNPAPSLQAFVDFFCAKEPTIPPEAGDATRTTMVQPNVYWTMITPLANIIGLYTNVPEHGVVQDIQKQWFINELKNLKKDTGKVLIITLHHPPYSFDTHHGASQPMDDLLNAAFKEANTIPDIVFTGHVHDYQRFTKTFGERKVPYLVIGAGGYWHLHSVDKQGSNVLVTPCKTPFKDVVLENYCDDHHGFMRITIDKKAKKLIGEYFIVPRPHESWKQAEELNDYFEIDLQKHLVKNGKL